MSAPISRNGYHQWLVGSLDNKTIIVTLIVTNAPIISLSANTPVQLAGYQGGPDQYAAVSLSNLQRQLLLR